MSIATLFTPIKDRNSREEFAFSNQDSHTLIVNRMYELFNLVLPLYPIYPIPADVENWSANHQQLHNDASRLLGTSNYDFTNIDFEDEEAMRFFVQIHGDSHREIHDLLRIGIDY